MKYKKKPVVIEAIQFDGMNSLVINEFTKGLASPTDDSLGHSNWSEKKLRIPTLEGLMIANAGDYVIKGVKGEFYPCKPDIFEMTYDKID